MATKGIKIPEKIDYSENKSVNDFVFNEVNCEFRTPLKGSTKYVLVPQNNFSAKYNINGREFTGPRFYLVEIDSENKPVEIRSISANSFTAMYIQRINDPEAPFPTFPTKMTEKGLRADCEYERAMNCGTTSFMRATEINGQKRLQIIKPVIIKVLRRGAVAVPKYKLELNTKGYHDVAVDENGRAVCQKISAYTFSNVEDVPTAVAKAAERVLLASDLRDLDILTTL